MCHYRRFKQTSRLLYRVLFMDKNENLKSEESKNIEEMFDRLNSNADNESVDENLSEEDRKKLFFWNECAPEEIDSSSIINKTFAKIERERKHNRIRRFIAVSSSAAAVFVLFIVSVYFLRWYNPQPEIEKVMADVQNMDVADINDITLYSGNDAITLQGGSVLKYNNDGTVMLNGDNINSNADYRYEKLIVPNGKHLRVILSDGTSVMMNSQSMLVFPNHFIGDSRDVYAKGEALMDVNHDAEHPFSVRTDGFKLKVLGTKFNINTHKGLESVVLARGAVEVTDTKSNKSLLSPEDKLNLVNGVIVGKEKVNVDEYISWAEGYLCVDDKPLISIANKLTNYYGIQVRCSSAAAKMKCYGKLELKDNLADVLKCLQQTMPIKIEKKNKYLYIE